MKRLLCFVVATVLCLPFSGAQNIETVYCKDGSEYSGYISRQIPGNNVTVNAVMAKIVVRNINVRESRYVRVPLSCLTDVAGRYLKQNKLANGDSVDVYTVTTDKTTYDEVLVVKRGNDSMTLLSFANTSYVLPWSSLKSTSKSPDNYQITEEVRLKSGSSIEGVITDQVIGSSLTLKTLKGSCDIKMSDITSISSRIETKDKKELWKKLPLFDSLTMLDGTEYEGYIVSRFLGTSVTILLRSNNQEKILPLRNIKVFTKVINPSVVCSGQVRKSGLLLKKNENIDNGEVASDLQPAEKSERVQGKVTVASAVEESDETSAEPEMKKIGEENNVADEVKSDEGNVRKESFGETKRNVDSGEVALSIKGARIGLSVVERYSGVSYIVGGGSVTVERGDYVTVDINNLYVSTANVFATKLTRMKNEESAYYGTKITSFSSTDDNPYTICDIIQRGKSSSKIGFSVTKRGSFALVLNEVYVVLVEVE